MVDDEKMSRFSILNFFKRRQNARTETKRIVFANARAGNKHEHFTHAYNKIKTSKYTIFTFLPFNLLEQFRRVANAYFLILIALQCIPAISSLEPVTTLLPLVIVLGITAAKDGLDDFNRHKSDKLVNNRSVELLDPEITQLREEKWMNVRTGDIIKINQDHQITADVLLLTTSDTYNLAYIETAELDGETNLKVRTAVSCTDKLMDSESDFEGVDVLRLAAFNGMIECELPNNRLDRFNGKLVWKQEGERTSRTFSLNNDNMLLRGTTMRNVDWAFGVVIFAGPDTKLMQNAGQTHFKRTSVDNFLNRLVIYIGFFLVLLALIDTIGHILFESSFGRNFQTYLPWAKTLTNECSDRNEEDDCQEGVPEVISGLLIFWSYIIILNTLVPISLYVSVEIIRLGQSFFINWDRQMYYEKKDQCAQARTTTLNEELGQVQYIFSDKTGTLTQNIMQFKMASINGHVYGGKPKDEPRPEPCDFRKFNPNYFDAEFEFFDNRLLEVISDKQGEVKEFFMLLALNHTVMPELRQDGSIDYQAQSPDEGALVKAARAFGFVFKSRTPESITIYDATLDEDVIFELLQILDFDNVRKRMSVIVRRVWPNGSRGPITLYCKGADTMVLDRLREPEDADFSRRHHTTVHLDEFSAEGLRTLCLAWKEIAEDEYEAWNHNHLEASCSIIDREEKVMHSYEQIETDMVLLGATAVEDKLQDEVPECIANLAKAGINLWVLTGDKQETAINIGYSCNLLTDEMLDVFIIDGTEKHEVAEVLRIDERVLANRDHPENDFGLVITGNALAHALDPDLQDLFVEVSLKCKAVICCRVTPLQKAKVVELVKRSQSAVTLAIGDGANDVSMIKEAQIGVGISGEEGTQAVLASDFSIAQFKYLERLLLVHGRWSYFRMCRFLDYFFYKNFAFTLMHFWFAFVSGFSATNAYDQWMITMYNVFYTSFPPLCIGLLDKDVNDKMCILNPKLYRLGQENKLFNLRIFIYSICRGIITSMVLFFIPFGVFIEATGNKGMWVFKSDTEGLVFGQQAFAFVVGTCLVIIVNIQVALDTAYWTVINHFFIWGSILLYFALHFFMYSNGLYGSLPDFFPFVGVGRFLIDKPQFWSSIVLTIVVYVAPVLAFRLYKSITKPTDADRIREERYRQRRQRRRQRGPHDKMKRRGGSQRPGTQRPGSSYAFSHQRGYADLIMSGRMTSRPHKEKQKKPTLEHLAKAALASQHIDLQSSGKVKESQVTFKNEQRPGDIELVRPSRVDSIVGMEKPETTHERLIE